MSESLYILSPLHHGALFCSTCLNLCSVVGSMQRQLSQIGTLPRVRDIITGREKTELQGQELHQVLLPLPVS